MRAVFIYPLAKEASTARSRLGAGSIGADTAKQVFSSDGVTRSCLHALLYLTQGRWRAKVRCGTGHFNKFPSHEPFIQNPIVAWITFLVSGLSSNPKVHSGQRMTC